MPTFGFADLVISYFNSGAGPIDDGPYGGTWNLATSSGTFPVPVNLSVVLGDDPLSTVDFLSLPTGSFVSVGFTDEVIVDGSGDDIFVTEVANEGETADIFVGSGGQFTFLGRAGGGQTSSFDLDDIGYEGFVTQVMIVGNDTGGGSPGYDLVNVRGLTDALNDLDDANDIDGSDGRDVIDLGRGNDSFDGGAGRDKAFGGAGRDDLSGGAGRDRLFGGAGRDELTGGNGNDTMRGGAGRDTFVFDRRDGTDKITDFNADVDLIEITSGAGRIGQIEMDQIGDDVMISFARTEIMLRNVDMDDLGRDDFLF